MSRKRLVLLVEGDGDVEAAPVLVSRLLHEHSAFDAVFLDSHPLRVGDYSKIRRSDKYPRIREHDFGEWRRLLQYAARRPNVGGCILLLDGDSPITLEGKPFCARDAARRLAAEAQKVGAGKVFSVAVVFACMEFESWLIAGIDSLLGKPLPDGRKEMPDCLPRDVQTPPNPDTSPRDAKGWLRRVMATGYKPARDQAALTRLVDLSVIRRRKEVRSFRRMESAIGEIVAAIRSGNHVVTPAS
jgi:hypothetical protein